MVVHWEPLDVSEPWRPTSSEKEQTLSWAYILGLPLKHCYKKGEKEGIPSPLALLQPGHMWPHETVLAWRHPTRLLLQPLKEHSWLLIQRLHECRFVFCVCFYCKPKNYKKQVATGFLLNIRIISFHVLYQFMKTCVKHLPFYLNRMQRLRLPYTAKLGAPSLGGAH
jgi:hypothetical protein